MCLSTGPEGGFYGYFHRGKQEQVQVQCCFTSTETTRTVSDGEPRTATSTFTQLLSSVASRFSGRPVIVVLRAVDPNSPLYKAHTGTLRWSLYPKQDYPTDCP